MGLFDAVDMTITPGWTNEAINTKRFAHAMKTKNQTIFPTVSAGGRYFWRHNGDPTTHGDIGMNRTNNGAFDWIIREAKAAGVLMR